MIENNFTDSDTLRERVRKLSAQTGIKFVLCYDTGILKPLYSLQYNKTRTGSMTAVDLMDWIAVFALGFRTAVARYTVEKERRRRFNELKSFGGSDDRRQLKVSLKRYGK